MQKLTTPLITASVLANCSIWTTKCSISTEFYVSEVSRLCISWYRVTHRTNLKLIVSSVLNVIVDVSEEGSGCVPYALAPRICPWICNTNFRPCPLNENPPILDTYMNYSNMTVHFVIGQQIKGKNSVWPSGTVLIFCMYGWELQVYVFGGWCEAIARYIASPD